MTGEFRKIGLIVNPVAGMGGRVGLKGTDGEAALRAAALGALPMASHRAARALQRLARHSCAMELVTCPGKMGEDAARMAGWPAALLESPVSDITTAADTRTAAATLKATGAGLILFAGGDGTARDMLDAVGEHVPILGIPSGVKMHSAVFATSPEAAGELAGLVAGDSGSFEFRSAEVMDIDEEEARRDRVAARLYGYAKVPNERRLVQGAKAASAPEDAMLDAAFAEITREMEPGVVYLFGPGTTTQRILAHLGLHGSLLGIDAAADGQLLGVDLSEDEIRRITDGRRFRILLGVVGGQGFIFGRGNQPLSPEVIRGAGRDNIIVAATQAKLQALSAGCLLADTGDPNLDRELCGFIRVRTGPRRFALMRVSM